MHRSEYSWALSFWTAVYFVICLAAGPAFGIGGGDQNPGLKTNQTAIRRWQDARFGITVHWGPVALRGTEIGWSRGQEVSKEDYDQLYKEFNPVLFNAAEWIKLFKDSGARYFTPVARHHDGFSMWHTGASDYNISKTPFGRDYLKELSEECSRQGIIFGTYYSILDWHHYDWVPNLRFGAGYKLDRPPDINSFFEAYIKPQVKELIVDYGSQIMLFDGHWNTVYTHERGGAMYKYIRNLRDEIVINDRVDKGKWTVDPADPTEFGKEIKVWDYEKFAGDYEEREQYVGEISDHPAEAWILLGEQWAWKANDKVKPPEEIIRDLIEAAGGNMNLNLNVTPMPDGRFEERQKRALLKIGAWLKSNGASIYETRGGPLAPAWWGVSTHRHNKVYLHIFPNAGSQRGYFAPFDWADNAPLTVPLTKKVKSARLLGGNDVKWSSDSAGTSIWVPASQRDPLDTIVEVTLD